MLFLGIDWGEHHHPDLCLLDQDGMMLAARRITDGLAGVGELHALVAAHAQGPAEVVVGIETDRGLLVGALLAAGYQMYAVNPHTVSPLPRPARQQPAKSDHGDAKVLADLVGTDRHNHRQVAGDSPLAEPEALAVLELAPTPEQGRRLTRATVQRALVGAGRRRNLRTRVVAVHDALAAPQLAAPAPIEAAYREVVGAPGGRAVLPQPAGRRVGAAARRPVRHLPGRRDSA
jgi:hypothetical protein